MAEESNTHMKVAMADVMGILTLSMFTFPLATFGLGMDTLGLVVVIGPWVGLLCLVTAVLMFLNENLLGTAIFGPLAIFFFTIVPPPSGEGAAVLCVLIGIIAFIDLLLSLAQPVKLLPILLGVAVISFFVTAAWFWGTDGTKEIMGALWMIFSIIAFYMSAAIVMLVLKGKQVLPLLIKA